MAGMLRNSKDQCIRNDGLVAGQSDNSTFPARTKPVSIRVSRDEFVWLRGTMKRCGYRNRGDLVEAAIAVLRGFARETPMPSWVQYAQKGTNNSNSESGNE